MFGTDIKKAIQVVSTATPGNTSFSADELKSMRLAPMLVGMFVSLSSPSGFIGSAQEAGAVVGMLADASSKAAEGSLVKNVFGSGIVQGDQQSMLDMMKAAQSPEALKTSILTAIGAAGKTAAKGSGPEAEGFKNMLVSVAHKVAEASKEGGFLGIGGTRVNDAEKAAITAIAGALGVKE